MNDHIQVARTAYELSRGLPRPVSSSQLFAVTKVMLPEVEHAGDILFRLLTEENIIRRTDGSTKENMFIEPVADRAEEVLGVLESPVATGCDATQRWGLLEEMTKVVDLDGVVQQLQRERLIGIDLVPVDPYSDEPPF